jgi:hypothetical protein
MNAYAVVDVAFLKRLFARHEKESKTAMTQSAVLAHIPAEHWKGISNQGSFECSLLPHYLAYSARGVTLLGQSPNNKSASFGGGAYQRGVSIVVGNFHFIPGSLKRSINYTFVAFGGGSSKRGHNMEVRNFDRRHCPFEEEFDEGEIRPYCRRLGGLQTS